MLKPEQAKKELEKLENEEWVQGRLASMNKLPARLRTVARPIIGHDDDGNSTDYEIQRKQRVEATPIVLGMNAAQRIELFEALFPGLGRAVEKGWQLFDRLPYQDDCDRKPFRAPGNEAALLNRRFGWVDSLLSTIGQYPPQNLAWYATWAAHFSGYSDSDQLGILFAAAIDAGGKEGDEVFEILCASARGEHEIGGMGRHVSRGLMCASRPDGWEFMEKMLLAAQREEGLRQTILESIDEAHPEAFRRMLHLILNHDLVRFSATVRALDTWLGYQWDSVSAGVVTKTIKQMLLYLEKPAARATALNGKDPEEAYLALWAGAFENADAAIAQAGPLLKHPKVEFRFIAAHLLAQIGLVEAQQKLLTVLEEEDLHVPGCALTPFENASELDEAIQNSNLFERVEKLLTRIPGKRLELKPLVWPWACVSLDREIVSRVMINSLGKRPPTRLIPHLSNLSPSVRQESLEKLCEQKVLDAASRTALLAYVGDTGRGVREAAMKGLTKCSVTAAEAPTMEELMTRSAGDLRRGILSILLKLPDEDALASADRLLAASSAPQRLAGLELLNQLANAKRCLAEVKERAAGYRAARPKLAAAERQQLDNIEAARSDSVSVDNALGLLNHDDRTWPEKPVNRKAVLHSPTSARLLQSLEELIHEHREKTICYTEWDDEIKQGLLGEVSYNFPSPNTEKSLEQDKARLPLPEIWEEWWQKRGKELRDADGFEILRALIWFDCVMKDSDEVKTLQKRAKTAVATILGSYTKPKLRYEGVAVDLLRWMHRLHPPANATNFLLDAIETSFALVPESELRHAVGEDDYDDTTWRDGDSPYMAWRHLASQNRDCSPTSWKPEHDARLFRLSRWSDQPFGRENVLSDKDKPIPRDRLMIHELLDAHKAGAATDADLLDQLLGTREAGIYGGGGFGELEELTSRKGAATLKKYPAAAAIVECARARVLEIELTRGDTPTPASQAALDLKTIHGIPNLMAVLRALGNRNFIRGCLFDSDRKETVLSHLARNCFPTSEETPEQFKTQAAAAGVPEQRLVELAVYAPQWVPHVEHALGWKSFAEGVWWIHAHTKDTDWEVEDDIRENWQADLTQRTALSSEDLLEGAVDVAWFNRIIADLGKERWAMLDEAAKYASNAGGHARARLFASAMLDQVSKKELTTRITKNRHQDSVRALGLLPLAEGKGREADVLERYKLMQEFVRTSRQFGAQRQASEKRAARIAQENLARTAGYPDPVRLQWAMEARAVADLAEGPITAKVEGVEVSLGIDPWGDIQFTVTKDGKALSDIPPKLKKNPKISALRERKTELKRQASRIRGTLEQFMCRGESMTGAELQDLMKHPLLAPMLSGLVLVGEGILGYPVSDGKVLEDHAGSKEALKKDEKVRIAHPLDLLPAAKWHAWQKDCFARERIQPFKQVFRELYTLTKPEKDEGTKSRRYAGHQVQPRQALALLGKRGWVHHQEEGVRKTHHEAGVTVWLEFQESFYTPAEVEGLTLESVSFTKRGDHKPLKLTEIPPNLFSETMRDLDLVVSVAHRGGVDPEASASTVEMRAGLVRNTCDLLKLKNVRLKDNYVHITGQLGEYTVHLGSAVTRKSPGETLFIIAVHAQHRGRLFLPFADDDPRTAEVLSKVLLLARDNEIKDPNILDQIRH